MAKKLPARPSLEHLRTQAKTLLRAMKSRDGSVRLADAQLQVARDSGFASWPALSRHVETLRALEGEWRFAAVEVDGTPMRAAALPAARILFDGDRFRSELPEARHEGVFTIDAEHSPLRIDISFVEGPEAGNVCYGIFQHNGEQLTLCLGLVGSPRPDAFAAPRGSGRALERLRRVSSTRPVNVTGGTPPPDTPPPPVDRVDPSTFDVPVTPLLRTLEGEWLPVELVMDGKPMPAEWLAYGSRTAAGNEVKVVFGGQTMVHAKVRIDETSSPMAVDYLNLAGRQRGTISRGIMEWIGDDVRFLMAATGEPRPASFDTIVKRGTLSRWRRR